MRASSAAMQCIASNPRIIFLSPVREFVLRLSNTDIGKDELTFIAGSVVLSDNPPQQLKFWRKKFGVKQADLAKKMAITPSVLSDYEKGRRPSPGANFIKRYLQALYELAHAPGVVQQVQEQAPQPMTESAVTINQP
jgi:putative transcriptional regulator